jgi:NTP pyrophosphatase (non-canonical NTP hydrolase)
MYNEFMADKKAKATTQTAPQKSRKPQIATPAPTTSEPHQPALKTPFSVYFRELDEFDKDLRYSEEYGSILILSLVEEIGEMARAYLAEHGRKPTNLAAQADETYEEELGDILVAILRFARIKDLNLDTLIRRSLKKVERRRKQPKPA